jgi:hypothetical protein
MKVQFLLFILFAVVQGNQQSHGEHPKPCGNVQLSPTLIPLLTEPLEVFKLGEPVLVPQDFLHNIAKNVVPDIELKQLGCGTLAAYANNTLVAYLDPKTGESKVFPLLESLSPANGLGSNATAIAGRLAANRTLFPILDSEKVIPLPPTTLTRSKSLSQGNATAPEDTLAYVRLQRQVNGYPVYGSGTQALIAVAADASLQGLAHRWQPASSCGRLIKPHSREEIADSIIRQLSPVVVVNETVTVQNVTIGYYDAGLSYLQPVYVFRATVLHGPSDPQPWQPNDNIIGYVSIGEAAEPIPNFDAPPNISPTNAPPPQRHSTNTRRSVPDPTVGRYVDPDDTLSPSFVDDANDFWNGLVQGSASSGIGFTNSQYYWTQQYQFMSDRNDFVNSVQIAYYSGHGNWGIFTTKDRLNDAADLVTLAGIGADGGYGTNAGGNLAFLIVHACEVIPTQTDEPNSFDVWWGVFKGLHSAIGFRTEGWAPDDVGAPFGKAVGLGTSVVSAWFNAVAASPVYPTLGTYLDGNRGINEPYGRAASVSVCGHVDDTARDVGPIPNPDCLYEYWMNN